ncbi:hypothetical protein DF3PA_210046 [Candidatus Defluviicoccus seviourii]|uniref:Uncharacterized protein n=2 Tax=root TaxID=1 RepID=A0A564WFU2_9PROT|nr:hypothetical protein DF3PB_3010004 [uncultured Defluviicoccus sp.]VUX46433.1 hypothetical protein DF3PA_210046 [Candidatus Defluviicoccus seviourii]
MNRLHSSARHPPGGLYIAAFCTAATPLRFGLADIASARTERFTPRAPQRQKIVAPGSNRAL